MRPLLNKSLCFESFVSDLYRNSEKVQREAVEKTLLKRRLLKGIATTRLLLEAPQPQGEVASLVVVQPDRAGILLLEEVGLGGQGPRRVPSLRHRRRRQRRRRRRKNRSCQHAGLSQRFVKTGNARLVIWC